MSLYNELKRRNVFKVTAAYIIVAWLLLQVSDTLVPALHLPEWFHSGVAFLLILGFPVALIFAWAFELTPEGLKKEKEVDRTQSITHFTGRKLDFTIIGLLLVAAGYLAFDKFVIDPDRDAEEIKTAVEAEQFKTEEAVQSKSQVNSIAVLPFVNMSDDSGNEYFSDGLSEELLNLLVKIPQLQVAARTSSFSFKGKDVKIAQIARELNVSHILEGSVRKAGNRVRITVQLIKADDGFHLWSETYDRTLDDIFVVQDEIANAVVAALKVTLMGAIPATRPTDPEVYSLYLQAKYLNNLQGKEDLEKALTAYEQALAIDPDYAPAWVGLNVVYWNQAKYGWRAGAQALDLSLAAVQQALLIDNKLASAWASLAYLKRFQWDWAGAKAAIEKALALEPNSTFVIGTAATLAGTFGQLEKSIELFERVAKLDPLSSSTFRALAVRYLTIGNFEKALETINQVKLINPRHPSLQFDLAMIYLLGGDPETALSELDKNPHYWRFDLGRAKTLSTLGREAEAQAIIKHLLETDEIPVPMATLFAWRGENDLAFEWFEVAFQQHDASFAFLLRNRWFTKLESDPRYLPLVEKLGLLDAWKTMPKPDAEAIP